MASKYCKDPNYAKGAKEKTNNYDSKKLKEISSQLKASAMHKAQAVKIDRMLKSLNGKKKRS